MKKMVVALVLIVAFAGVSITGMVMGDIKCGESSQTITLSLEKGHQRQNRLRQALSSIGEWGGTISGLSLPIAPPLVQCTPFCLGWY